MSKIEKYLLKKGSVHRRVSLKNLIQHFLPLLKISLEKKVISENNVLYSDIAVCNTSPVRDSMLSQSDTLQEIYDDFKGTNSSSNRKRKKRQVGPGPGPTQPGILHSLVCCLKSCLEPAWAVRGSLLFIICMT